MRRFASILIGGATLASLAIAVPARAQQTPEEKEIIARFQHALHAYNTGKEAQGCLEMGKLFDDTGDITAMRAHADPLMKFVPLGPTLIGIAVGEGEKRKQWAKTCFVAYEGAYILRQKGKPDDAEKMLVRARAAFGQWAQTSAAQALLTSPAPTPSPSVTDAEKAILTRVSGVAKASSDDEKCSGLERVFADTADAAALRPHSAEELKQTRFDPEQMNRKITESETSKDWAKACAQAFGAALIMRFRGDGPGAETLAARARGFASRRAPSSKAVAATAKPDSAAKAEPVAPDALPAQAAPDAQAVLAAAASGTGSRVALVIANARYSPKTGVPSLRTPTPDAALIANTLRKAGFNDVTVASDLGRREMADALRRFQDKAGAADTALIYYAGHGLQAQGENYAVPVDAQLSDERSVVDEAVSQARLMDAMASTRKLKILVMDACRNTPLKVTLTAEGTAAAGPAAGGGGEATRSLSRGLVRVIPPKSHSVVVYSAGPGQTALDGDGADSPFASALAKRMLQPGVEIDLMLRQVASDVSDATGDKQRPNIAGNLGADPFFFVPPKG